MGDDTSHFILFYLVNSVRVGFVFSALYLLIYLWILVDIYEIEFEKNAKPYVNFILSYLIVWGISHVYEKNRVTSSNQLTNLALRDALTNTNNRLALTYEFQKRKNNRNGLGLALLDIDYFKNVNDTYGHGVGDEVLTQLSLIFQQHVGSANVFRLGGEEFVLLWDNDEEEALGSLSAIREKIAREVFCCSNELRLSITISAGFVYFNQLKLSQAESLSTLLEIADKHLYEAKEQGRNRVCSSNKH